MCCFHLIFPLGLELSLILYNLSFQFCPTLFFPLILCCSTFSLPCPLPLLITCFQSFLSHCLLTLSSPFSLFSYSIFSSFFPSLSGWLAESGVKNGPWLYRPEPSSIGYANETISKLTFNTTTMTNSTTTTIVLRPFTQNNDVLMRSAFSHFYQMDKIGVFRQFFATVFPIFLIIVMFLVMTNVLNYLLVLCKLEYMQMGTSKTMIDLYQDALFHLFL